MKYIFLISIIIAAMLLHGCDQRTSSLYEDMEAPSLSISNEISGFKSVIVDTIKMNGTYQIMLASEIKEYQFDFVNAQVSYDNEIEALQINPDTDFTGEVVGKITVIDFLENQVSAEVDLQVIENWLPVVVADVQVVADISPYEIEVDLSQSYDADERFGGEVVQYHYRIIGETSYNLTTDLSSIRYIFQTSGQKSIRVRVQDNDGAWSQEEIIYITL